MIVIRTVSNLDPWPWQRTFYKKTPYNPTPLPLLPPLNPILPPFPIPNQPWGKMSRQFCLVKWTISVISSDPPCKDGNEPGPPIYLWKLFLIKYDLDIHVFLSLNVYFYLRFLCESDLRNAHFLFIRSNEETPNDDGIFDIFIRLRFQGYRCESGIAIFAWRVIWDYAYSPFNTTGNVASAGLLQINIWIYS